MMLANKSVLVVGGSSGIGLAVAREALARGAEVVIAARSQVKLDDAAATLGSRVRTVAIDVGREEDVARLFEAVPSYDHLVVTAVDPGYQPILELDLAVARRIIDSKLIGALLLAKHGTRRARPGGSITLTGGIAAERPSPNGAIVAAVNGALVSLARALALELAPLRVNVVSPGWIDTPVWDKVAGAGKSAAFESMARRLPTGRIGRADEVAHAIAFLMENELSTGSVLHVDGGHRLI